MRIISGIFKGKKILEPKDKNTRPLKDMMKESIFNIINHSKKFDIKLNHANVLDLFSGVGSFGIECLSRGSKKVVFIENYEGVLPILRKNLQSLKQIENYQIIEKDIYNKNLHLYLKTKFDLVFIDPPFKDKNLEVLFYEIFKSGILKNESIIILHRHKDEKKISLPNIKIIEEKKYGLSKIFFLSYLN